jgi:hypothetical protein
LQSDAGPIEIPAPARGHKLIEGLFQELPEPWTAVEKARWLRLAASVFDVLYETDDKIVTVEVKTAPGGNGAKIEQTERS